MKAKGYRHNKIKTKKRQNKSVSKLINKESQKLDAYLAVWVLKKLGWSSRRIARLELPTSHHTVNSYFSEACELIDTDVLPIFNNKSRGGLKIIPLGSSNEIDYLHGKINANQCGGGRRVVCSQYKDDWHD